MTSAAQVRAALDALFDTPTPTPATPAVAASPSPEPPHNLDDAIRADAELSWEVETHRWFAGRDARGIVRIFRFQRGFSLMAWHETLRKQMLTSVTGPYRNQGQAQREH